MFEIETYIKKGKLSHFVPYSEVDFSKFKLDIQYLEGAIQIKYKDQYILGFDEWDLVVELWIYFIQSFYELEESGYVAFYFPDQPLQVKMKKIGQENMILEVGEKKYYLPRRDFIKEMKNSASEFFSQIDFHYGLQKIKEFELNFGDC